MKKQYISPRVDTILIASEGFLAASTDPASLPETHASFAEDDAMANEYEAQDEGFWTEGADW